MKGKEIVTFITRHTYTLSQFKKVSPTLDLKKYSARFPYNFLMLDRLVAMHNISKQLEVSDEWNRWPTSHSTHGTTCYTHIMDHHWQGL